MRKFLIGMSIFVGIIVLMGTFFFITIKNNMQTILEINLETIDFTDYEDGTYLGKYYYEDQIGATVNVTISDGKITEIEILEHLTGLGQEAENIINDVISEQTIEVDAISGATTSSKVLQLAIQDALLGGETDE
jgi:uncharacterized protein with FMN-binding domain